MKYRIGLVPRIIIGISLGIIAGIYLPESILRVSATFSELFSQFLSFFIPLMIVGFVVVGIGELRTGAGKLLGITTLISYTSTVLAGTIALLIAMNFFPNFISNENLEAIKNTTGINLTSYFSVKIAPMFGVTTAIVFSFVFGLGISYIKEKTYIYGFFKDYNEIIKKTLSDFIIPLLPIHIFGVFANMSFSGSVFTIISIFIKVFIVIILLHLIYISFMFFIAGGLSSKNPVQLIKNQIPGYLTAIGTQSSAATIPINIECAKKNGVSQQIRDFVIPLCATIHLSGSIITIVSCVTAVLILNNMPVTFDIMIPFIFMLGIAMVAAPGAPGGGIMSALPFLYMVGITPESGIPALLIALYITQDSFGTAANVSGDNAIALIVDRIYKDK